MHDDEQSHTDETDAFTPDTDTEGSGVELVTEFQFPQSDKPKVAIVGFAAGTAHKAPFSDDDVEKWGINQLWKILPDRKFDRWFELHSLYDFYHANEPHKDWLRQFAGPVYVREQDYPLALEWGIDTAQPFPHRVLLDNFRPYFNNTISWLIALAIMMHPEWIGMYGVDMAQDHLLAAEYSEQRPSCEFFLGLAEGLGIEVDIPNGSDLLAASHLYGYEDSGRVLEKMGSRFVELGKNKEQIMGQMQQIETQLNGLRATVAQMDGAQQEVTYWRKNWMTLPAEPEGDT